MRFSIQQVPSEKMFFHTIPPAERATGLHRSTIQGVLNSGAYVYHRKKDNQIFHIRKEDPILIAEINGEKFFSLEEIGKKFGISPTKFMNQIQNKKFSGKINWISDELFPEREAKRVKEASEASRANEMGGKDLIAEIQELRIRVEKLEMRFRSIIPQEKIDECRGEKVFFKLILLNSLDLDPEIDGIFSRRKRFQLKHRGMKNEIMKFLGFPNFGDEFQFQNLFKKKKF